MTPGSTLALIGAMLILALIPGPGVMAVTAKSMKEGSRQGAFMVAGVLLADYLFIAMSMSMAGLFALAEIMGSFFVILKYIAACYLIWLAITIWREPVAQIQQAKQVKTGGAFISGFLLTLANPKAILFYVGFFPTFLDMSGITVKDVFVVYLVTTLTIGGVTLGYVLLANKAGELLLKSGLRRKFNLVAGGIMASSGIALLVKD